MHVPFNHPSDSITRNHAHLERLNKVKLTDIKLRKTQSLKPFNSLCGPTQHLLVTLWHLLSQGEEQQKWVSPTLSPSVSPLPPMAGALMR